MLLFDRLSKWDRFEDYELTPTYELAKAAHAGQIYKPNRDYFDYHVRGVAYSVYNDPEARHVHVLLALLHDVVEDSPVTLKSIGELAELPKHVVEYLDNLTKRPGESYLNYIRRAGSDPASKLVKLHDLKFNLANKPPAKLAEKYTDAIEILNEET